MRHTFFPCTGISTLRAIRRWPGCMRWQQDAVQGELKSMSALLSMHAAVPRTERWRMQGGQPPQRPRKADICCAPCLRADSAMRHEQTGRLPLTQRRTCRTHHLTVQRSGGDPQAGVLLETGVVTGKDLLATLERVEARLLRDQLGRRPLRLIVVDSIANVFRSVSYPACIV